MADAVELRMSVTAIKRVDPYVKDILSKSTHVALYRFNPGSNEWEKTETEGALFLYSRNGEPDYSLMIMNRLNTTNKIEPIVKDFEYQMQAPFLLYRNSKSKIFGIWFYNREECVNITLILQKVMDGFKEKSADKSEMKVCVDIFGMLTRAQENFNKTPNKNDNKQPQFSTPHAPDVTSQSVMDFFAKASSKTAPKPVHNTAGDGEIQFTFQRLMSNPVHSVEHIEKQQRSITPQEVIIMRPQKVNTTADRRSAPIQFQRNATSDTFIRVASPHLQSQSPLANFLANTMQQQQQPIQSTSLQQPVTMTAHSDDMDLLPASPLAQLLDTPQKPSLMPPMMFATSATAENMIHHNHQHNNKSPSNNSSNNSNNIIEPLTKNQILQALTYMLKHDSDFITKLHEAYVKSLSEMVNHNNSLI